MLFTMYMCERASVIIQVMLFQWGPIFFRSIFGTKISQDNEASAQELSGLLSLEQFQGTEKKTKEFMTLGLKRKR